MEWTKVMGWLHEERLAVGMFVGVLLGGCLGAFGSGRSTVVLGGKPPMSQAASKPACKTCGNKSATQIAAKIETPAVTPTPLVPQPETEKPDDGH